MLTDSSCLSVHCEDERGPLCGCRVLLCNACGCSAGEAVTDECGKAMIKIPETGDYRLRVSARDWHSPKAQNRWLHLPADRSLSCRFLFNLPACPPRGNGTLLIRLCDAHYPQYTLSKGVYSLWRIF
jgi:hypothetical protein